MARLLASLNLWMLPDESLNLVDALRPVQHLLVMSCRRMFPGVSKYYM